MAMRDLIFGRPSLPRRRSPDWLTLEAAGAGSWRSVGSQGACRECGHR
jgi:hypothetical protein